MTVILGLLRPRHEADVFLLLYHVYRPSKRGFYSFLDNFNIEMKSKWMNALFIPCKIWRVYIFLCQFKLIAEMNKVERSESWQILTLWWPTVGGGGGGGPAQHQIGFSSQWWELLLLLLFQTNFVFVGTSLEHLSMKKFSDWTYGVCSKIRGREGAWDPPPPLPSLHGHWVTIDLFFWPWTCI